MQIWINIFVPERLHAPLPVPHIGARGPRTINAGTHLPCEWRVTGRVNVQVHVANPLYFARFHLNLSFKHFTRIHDYERSQSFICEIWVWLYFFSLQIYNSFILILSYSITWTNRICLLSSIILLFYTYEVMTIDILTRETYCVQCV